MTIKRYAPGVLLAVSILLRPAFGQLPAGFSPASEEQAIAIYDPTTGEVWVSANSIVNWYIESSGASFTGDEPALPAANGLVTNSDIRIGETSLTPMLYERNLGHVAMTGLPITCSPGGPCFIDDIAIHWNVSLGSNIREARALAVPEPTSGSGWLLVLVGSLRRAFKRRPERQVVELGAAQ